MPDTPAPDRPRARDDVVLRPLDEEWVIFDPAADKLHALNVTAALVWMHCTGSSTMEDIADAVGAAFEPPVKGATIIGDIREAVDRFRREGLLA